MPLPQILTPEQIDYIVSSMDDAVCLTSLNGELLYSNQAARDLFGFGENEHGKIWDAIPYVEGNDRLIQVFIDAVVNKSPVRSITDYVNNEGQLFHLHVSLTCDTENSRVITIVINNLTDLIKARSALARFTSPEIAEYVLSSSEEDMQAVHSRDVSILMADLRGFTAISSTLSPAALVHMLNHFFESMTSVIDRFLGIVIEFLGDGIFVVFGAAKDSPDHASVATACAIEMQNAMPAVNEWNRANGFPDLEMGIGIHSGPAVVGNIGSRFKMKFGCVGETVNIAGRVESQTVGGQVLISESTRNRIPEQITVSEIHSFMPKGGRSEIRIYSIIGLGDRVLFSGANTRMSWRKLPAEKEVSFSILDNKEVTLSFHRGWITDLTEDHKYVALITSQELNPLQNLMIQLNDQEVYAKVMNRHQNEYHLCFTSATDEFIRLLQDHR